MSDEFRDAVDVEHRVDQYGGVATYVLPNGTRAATTHGALSAVIGRAVYEQHQCQHPSFSEEAGYPDRNGRCAVHVVCEDCGAVGRQIGWDSVL